MGADRAPLVSFLDLNPPQSDFLTAVRQTIEPKLTVAREEAQEAKREKLKSQNLKNTKGDNNDWKEFIE